MNKTIIQTSNAPMPIGPYSQAVLSNGTLYISGQIALDPKTGELVTHDLSKETELVMSNLSAVLEAAGLNFSHVVKTSIFLSNMNLFSGMNDVYARYFESDPPARETVAVAGLPKGVNVEISMIATL